MLSSTAGIQRRLHIDLRAGDRTAEVARLAEIGASVLATFDEWTASTDPEGNEFCVRD